MNMNLKKTPLYDEHLKLHARMVPFAGWLMPVQYSGILKEHEAVRTQCGLFDVSHMGEFFVRGAQAQDFLQKMITNDLSAIQPGQALYTFMCKEDGGCIDDLIVYKISQDYYLMCVNASNIQKDFDWLMIHKPQDIDLINESDSYCLLALQGPSSTKVLQALFEKHRQKLADIKSFHFIEGKKVFKGFIARTGYTGEMGYELFVKNESAVSLWQELLELGKPFGIIPVGLGARDTLRLEMGYPLYGHDLDENTTPIEARLKFFVKLNKSSFLGQEKLLEQDVNKCSRYLIALVLKDKGVLRDGFDIYDVQKQKVGLVTSGTFSPSLKKAIALGYVDSKFFNNSEFYVDIRGKFVLAEKTKLPFYRREANM
ncbi:MAG: glycine cleavage system aminomethyltransferase GcvT [Deltaproteobacteria bacterium]|nr:glycine cleavage system aminomethyltransferase GcvT [Deltaproteobacteria bacterium]